MRRRKSPRVVWDGRAGSGGSEQSFPPSGGGSAADYKKEVEMEAYKQRLAEGPSWMERQPGDRTPLAEFDRAGEEAWWNETFLMAFRLGLEPPVRKQPPEEV